MRTITMQQQSQHQNVHQYFGKWPFRRFFGIQEPASVVFSLLNLNAHLHGLRRSMEHVPRRSVLFPWLIGNGVVGSASWIFSAIFHCRDTKITEKADYFGAMLYIVYVAVYGISKVFGLDVFSGPVVSSRGIARIVLFLIFGSFYSIHVLYLTSLEKFDYSYNIIAGVIVGLVSNSAWLIWTFSHWGGWPKAKVVRELWFGHGIQPPYLIRKNSSGRPYSWKMTVAVLGVTVAMLLELLDFSPIWDIFDAHSLWHATTIPLTFLYYDFLVEDAIWEHRKSKGKFVAAAR
ncbi:hypothetical protein HK096_010360 [Nowakowskiella sp. JEL0078]|nr:hypothetical protein HK096_010360 [Nowakowskiella sp. JEL0078]